LLHPQVTPFVLGSILSGLLLVGPKLMGAFLVLQRPGERRAFGGARAVVASVAAEILRAASLAPGLMVANTISVAQIVRGRDAGWGVQQRAADGIAWRAAFRAMRPQMIAGGLFTAALCLRPDLAISFAPIVLPLLFAAPLAVLTSRQRTGELFARAGILTTPDDDRTSAIATVPAGAARPAWA
jgi:membrane glycosyltransferase